MTPRRKRWFMIMMGISVTAMFVDRFLVGYQMAGPQGASAGTVTEHAGQVGGISVRTGDSVALIPEVPFPKNLPESTSRLMSRDLFRRPGRTTSASSIGSAPAKPDRTSNSQTSRSVAEEFPERHRLEAVMLDGERAIAIVDGQWLREGSLWDGCRLHQIGETKVHFQCNDGDTILQLETTLPLSGTKPVTQQRR
ncbi:MAG: hypothetical protein J5J06_04475 [Phycisphaerae bacterium]|nr:hypothetical protein [Phycisphaerae bacterium]